MENKQDQEETEKQEEEGYKKYAFYGEAYRTALKGSESKTSSSNNHSSSYQRVQKYKYTITSIGRIC